MAKYRKKPVVIEAYQLPDGNDTEAVEEFNIWAARVGFINWSSDYDGISIETLEGIMFAGVGDWIIKGVAGEFYPCKDEIFKATYEPVFSLDLI